MELEKLHWDTIRRTEGDALVIDFDGRPPHIAVIPFEVLEDGLRTTDEEPLASARANRAQVESAIAHALNKHDWRELVNLQTGQILFQLWVKRSHFSLR